MTDAGREYDAVVAGYIGIDMAPEFPKTHDAKSIGDLLRPGKLIETGELSVSLGGVVANTGLAMHIFGKRVALNSVVGEDMLGETVLSLLGRYDAHIKIDQKPDVRTAYSIVLAPPGTDRIFIESPGCNREFDSSDIDYDLAARGRIFHFGYPPLMERLFADDGRELEKIFTCVKETDTVTSLDMTVPDSDSPSGKADWSSILKRVLPHVDIFVPSIEELVYMLDSAQYTDILSEFPDDDIVDRISEETYIKLSDQLLDMGVKVVMVKAGHKGAYLRTGDISSLNALTLDLPDTWSDSEMWIPACEKDDARFKNSCGAGDAAIAAFLSAMLDAETAESAGRLAMIAGCDNLYGVDALGGLRDWGGMREKA